MSSFRLNRIQIGALLAILMGVSPLLADTIVQLDTPLGTVTFQLYDTAKPVTVANFLNYIRSGRYTSSFAHRLPAGFVLQGGGYTYTSSSLGTVPTDAAIANEAGPFPQYSNVMGTLAMAKLGGQPNSATSQWFINLADNSTNLDVQNGGFTVFGSVLTGMSVLTTFAHFSNYQGADASNVIADLSGGNPSSPFTDVPLTKIVNQSFDPNNLIYTTWSIPANAPQTPTPAPPATTAKPDQKKPVLEIFGGLNRVTTFKTLILIGKSSDNVGVASLQIKKVGHPFSNLPTNSYWSSFQNLTLGRNTFVIVATDTSGNSSQARVVVNRIP